MNRFALYAALVSLAACTTDAADPPGAGAPLRVYGPTVDMPFALAGDVLSVSVVWRNECVVDPITEATEYCDEQTFTVEMTCDGVPCEIADTAGTHVGQAVARITPLAAGTLAVDVVVRDENGEIVLRRTLDAVPVRNLDAITLDCFYGPDSLPCVSPIPASEAVIVFAIGHAGDAAFDLDRPWQTWATSQTRTWCSAIVDAPDYYPANTTPPDDTMQACLWESVEAGVFSVEVTRGDVTGSLTVTVQ